MQIGKVIGSVVATRKAGKTDGLKILVVEEVDESLKPKGKSSACIDSVGAGKGDVVMICSSSSARKTALTQDVCTDNTIVGIIDTINKNGKVFYSK